MRTLIAILWLGLAAASAQAPAPPEAIVEAPARGDRDALYREVVARIATLDAAIPEVERALRLNDRPEAVREVQAHLDDLRAELEAQRAVLDRLVSGLDPAYAIGDPAAASLRWQDEAQELLAPLLSGLKQATVRPRRLEKLRTRLSQIEDQRPRVEAAVDKAQEAMDRADSPTIRAEIRSVMERWQDRAQRLQDDNKVVQAELRDVQAGTGGGLGAAAQGFLRLFLRSRVRNGLLALGALLGGLLLTRLVHRLVFGSVEDRDDQGRSLTARVAELSFTTTGILLSILGSLGGLYASGDWVLLTLGIGALAGLVWGLRAAVPRFWREGQLLLNVGPVRQGERVVWQGIPWRVRSLHILSVLENPAFPDTYLRLPLASLIPLTSRPGSPDEPWFPTVRGDWILWDGLAAEVLAQGPEFVTLRRDRSQLTVPTQDFLAAGIVNLSHGFRHRVTLTLDYRHQGIATSTAPLRLKEHVRAALEADRYWPHVLLLSCDFDAATADRWEALGERIQAATVDACNAEGWEIALPQLTLHQAPVSPPAAPDLARGAEAHA